MDSKSIRIDSAAIIIDSKTLRIGMRGIWRKSDRKDNGVEKVRPFQGRRDDRAVVYPRVSPAVTERFDHFVVINPQLMFAKKTTPKGVKLLNSPR